MPFGQTHEIILGVASKALWAFFSDVRVIGSENVPETGPVILACTHHSMAVDAAVLSWAVPYHRRVHYWAKSSLFKNPVAGFILRSSGVLPVDRKNKDNQVLFRSTFEALAHGEIVGVFPEGTSYTEPRIMQVKDGVAWSALEYMKWNRTKVQNGDSRPTEDAVVIPVGIVYTDKSKYRSSAVVEFGKPITVAQFEADFLSTEDGAARTCAKALTKQIQSQMLSLTINAPDWETLYSAKMTRSLLWPRANSLQLTDFVPVSQVLVDLFSEPNSSPLFGSTRKALLTYHSLLESSKLSHEALADLPLPRTLDPAMEAPLPSRLSTLAILLKDTLTTAVRLPFFVLPLIIHLPAYGLARVLARMVEEEEETQAQMKMVAGILGLAMMAYPIMFLFLWAFLWLTPTGALVAAGFVWMLAIYHVSIIDDNYEHVKRFVAAWRVLIGVWGPRRWELSRAAVEPWTKPRERPPNEWIQSTQKPEEAAKAPKPTPSSSSPKRKKRPASRNLIRHVLRARLNASRALANYLEELQRSDRLVVASQYMPDLDEGARVPVDKVPGSGGVGLGASRRTAMSAISYLRSKGAKVTQLSARDSSDWAALSSDGEPETPFDDRSEDLVWVPPRS
ncbi:acyltransferase [Ceratobasidium sp. AG-Ba]|nr:acyltransferase [Ceratobasidium sp. AG-Ba]QRW08032.1 acyltransferase [Ceratobasidium sp. AG-Ba]